jgi:hypothetical protein
MDNEEISANSASTKENKTKVEANSLFTAIFKLGKNLNPQITAAIITAIAAIIVALPTLLPFISSKLSTPPPTLAPIATLSPTPFITSTSIIPTDTQSPTILPSFTSALTATAVSSETMTLIPQPKLIVLLEVDKTSGRKPLTVKLDARASYLTDSDGQTYVCRNGACYYTWKVYSGGQQLGKSVTDSGGTFDYTFGKQGTYMITVWICRGKDGADCGGSGAQIVVTK